MAQTVERMGRLDIVVANAGVCDWQTVADMSADLWDRIVGRQPARLLQHLPCGRRADARRRRGRPHRRDVVGARADAVRADERLRRHEAGRRAPRRRDGARVGARRHHGQPHRPGLGGERDQRHLSRLQHGGGAARSAAHHPGRASRRASPRRWARPSRTWRATRPRYTTGAYIRVDGGLVMGPY